MAFEPMNITVWNAVIAITAGAAALTTSSVIFAARPASAGTTLMRLASTMTSASTASAVAPR